MKIIKREFLEWEKSFFFFFVLSCVWWKFMKFFSSIFFINGLFGLVFGWKSNTRVDVLTAGAVEYTSIQLWFCLLKSNKYYEIFFVVFQFSTINRWEERCAAVREISEIQKKKLEDLWKCILLFFFLLKKIEFQFFFEFFFLLKKIEFQIFFSIFIKKYFKSLL